MPSSYTADQLLTLMTQIGSIPDGTPTADKLRDLNRCMRSIIAPQLFDANEGYFLRAIQTPLVASQSTYPVSPRAMLGKLADLRYITPDGGYDQEFSHITQSGSQHYSRSPANWTGPAGFVLDGMRIRIVPPVGTTHLGTLEQVVPLMPGELVEVSETRTVDSVDSSTVVTLSSGAPVGWSTASKIDVHSATSGAELRCFEKAVAGLSGTTLTFATAIDGSVDGELAVEVGDYVCLAGEAAIPALPIEYHPLIAHGAASYWLEESDPEQAQLMMRSFASLLKALLKSSCPRIKEKRKLITGAPYLGSGGY